MATTQQGQIWRDERDPSVNVSSPERTGALIMGGLLVLTGLRRRSNLGLFLMLAGGGLIYTGMTGHCAAYESMGIDTAHEDGGQVGAGPQSQQQEQQAPEAAHA